jgi:hypothetical protein
MVSVSGDLGEGLNNLMHALLKEKLMPLDTVVSITQFLSFWALNYSSFLKFIVVIFILFMILKLKNYGKS